MTAEMICRKTMRPCMTPGMCAPFQGCGTIEKALTEQLDRIAKLEADLAAAQAERDALRERANALLHQIDIGDYVESEGHALKNNIAVLTLMKALTNV